MLLENIPKKRKAMLKITVPRKHLEIICEIKDYLDSKTVEIELHGIDIGDKVLNFKNVNVDFQYEDENLITYTWKSVNIVRHSKRYIMRTRTENSVKQERIYLTKI